MSMGCPYCAEDKTAVISTRPEPAGVRRRRRCPTCGGRFWTVERAAWLDAPPTGKRPRRPKPRPYYAGHQAYLKLAVMEFTSRWRVQYPAEATMDNEEALRDWCETLGKLRGEE